MAEQSETSAEPRLRSGDRLISSARANEVADISPMTAWRWRKADADFPELFLGKLIEREWLEYLARRAARTQKEKPTFGGRSRGQSSLPDAA
jgi:hypothetical protein